VRSGAPSGGGGTRSRSRGRESPRLVGAVSEVASVQFVKAASTIALLQDFVPYRTLVRGQKRSLLARLLLRVVLWRTFRSKWGILCWIGAQPAWMQVETCSSELCSNNYNYNNNGNWSNFEEMKTVQDRYVLFYTIAVFWELGYDIWHLLLCYQASFTSCKKNLFSYRLFVPGVILLVRPPLFSNNFVLDYPICLPSLVGVITATSG
jgi:hypothetical protein